MNEHRQEAIFTWATIGFFLYLAIPICNLALQKNVPTEWNRDLIIAGIIVLGTYVFREILRQLFDITFESDDRIAEQKAKFLNEYLAGIEGPIVRRLKITDFYPRMMTIALINMLAGIIFMLLLRGCWFEVVATLFILAIASIGYLPAISEHFDQKFEAFCRDKEKVLGAVIGMFIILGFMFLGTYIWDLATGMFGLCVVLYIFDKFGFLEGNGRANGSINF